MPENRVAKGQLADELRALQQIRDLTRFVRRGIILLVITNLLAWFAVAVAVFKLGEFWYIDLRRIETAIDALEIKHTGD